MDIDELADWIGTSPRGVETADHPSPHARRVSVFWTMMAERLGLDRAALLGPEARSVRTCVLLDLMLESSPAPNRSILLVDPSEQDRAVLHRMPRVVMLAAGADHQGPCAAIVFRTTAEQIAAGSLPRILTVEPSGTGNKLMVVT